MASSLLPPPTYGVGLDIAKDTFTACLLQRTPAGGLLLVQQPKAPFANSARGVAALLGWLARYRPADASVAFILEATGSYYEELAYALHAQGYRLHVCQPLQVKQFARSTSTKSKNDALDARLLATFGLTRALPAWQPFSPQQRHLRALLREQADLLTQRTQLRNRRHAWQHSYLPDPATLARLDAQEALLVAQHQAITAELAQLIAADAALAQPACKPFPV
jgi:transposase